MNTVLSFAQTLAQKLHINLSYSSFSPSYIQAGAIILLIFILVLTMAQLRRHLVDWSIKGAMVGIFFGFLFALILEGFLVVGGKTALTEVLGWKNAPQPIADALDMGREKLTQVLGVQTSVPIPPIVAKSNPTFDDAVGFFQSLNPSDIAKIKTIICKP